VRQGDLRLSGIGAPADSSEGIQLFAGGDVIIDSLIQNLGSGAASLVAGWDGLTGLSESYGNPGILSLALDLAAVLADDAAWGNGGEAIIGNGQQGTAVAFGSAGGTTTVLGEAVRVIASTHTAHAYARIGAQDAPGATPTQAIVVAAKQGGIQLQGGDQIGTYAQIGHRSLGTTSSALAGDIRIRSLGGVEMHGGSGLLAAVQVGHGGASSTVASLSGDIAMEIADELILHSGSGGGAYAQVGHGGYITQGDFHGDVEIAAGGQIALSADDPDSAAYAKIGHGDDLRGSFASLSSSGNRS